MYPDRKWKGDVMKDVLKALNQRPVAYYPIYAVGTGSIPSAVALSQLMYWFGVSRDKIYKTDSELKEETGLSDKEIRTVKKKLKTIPFLTVTREGVPAKTFYEIDWEKYKYSMSQWSKLDSRPKKEDNTDKPNGTNSDVPMVQTITENTQRLPENTSHVTPEGDNVIPEELTASMVEAIEVAEHLSIKLSESIENYKAPTEAGIKKWANDIDRSIRLDNRTKDGLIEAINWIHKGGGSFWIGNVKSGKKLREQFDTLTAQRAPRKTVVPIRTRALDAFGIGKVFFQVMDKSENRELHICLFGDYGALYDYRGNKYIDKVQSEKIWPLIENDFESIVARFNAKEK